MGVLNPRHLQNWSVWCRVPVWLAVFLSPTAYVLLLMVVDRLHGPAPPEALVVSLFCLIPVVAVVACGILVWRSGMSLRWRLGGVALAVLGMVMQCGVWYVIIVSAITAAIAPAQ